MSSEPNADEERHPLSRILAEHRELAQRLDEMERECLALSRGGPLRPEFWEGILGYFAETVDGLHHAREERLLFAALEQRGLSPHGHIATLRREHERARAWRARIRSALAQRDGLRLQATVAGLIDFERQHIRKEDQMLIPLARQALEPQDIEELAKASDALEAEHARGSEPPARANHGSSSSLG
ncbi:MAG: hypothetical protein Fur0037_07780 [Planctomycetota bacterium]